MLWTLKSHIPEECIVLGKGLNSDALLSFVKTIDFSVFQLIEFTNNDYNGFTISGSYSDGIVFVNDNGTEFHECDAKNQHELINYIESHIASYINLLDQIKNQEADKYEQWKLKNQHKFAKEKKKKTIKSVISLIIVLAIFAIGYAFFSIDFKFIGKRTETKYAVIDSLNRASYVLGYRSNEIFVYDEIYLTNEVDNINYSYQFHTIQNINIKTGDSVLVKYDINNPKIMKETGVFKILPVNKLPKHNSLKSFMERRDSIKAMNSF